MTPQERFAQNLRRRRVAVGISQEELGERTELHRTEISLLERAGREPRFATLLKLARGARARRPNELCEGTGWDHEKRRFTVEDPPRRLSARAGRDLHPGRACFSSRGPRSRDEKRVEAGRRRLRVGAFGDRVVTNAIPAQHQVLLCHPKAVSPSE